MRQRSLRPFWILLALLFLMEAWLWDHLKRVIEFLVGLLPLDPVKAALRRWMMQLPPWAALGAFVIPFLLLLPLKFAEVYFLATRQWFAAFLVVVFAKLLGLGLIAFVFDATRAQLMQLAWFRALYRRVTWALDWAHAQVEPVKAQLRRYLKLLRPDRAGRLMRLLLRLRRRAQRA